ncbi:hypothetical protein DRP04_00310 [Archaeoglobales archaeon]|nr:MAG: hypothetical protein DRP04_00310 [Archaeoglobales archaeon]
MEVRTLKKLIPVLGLLLIVAAIGTVSAETFYIKVSTNGYGTGTVVDSVSYDDFALSGTGFEAKDMYFRCSHSTVVNLDEGLLRDTKCVDVDAHKLTSFESQIHVDDIVDTMFAVYNARDITINYRAGVTVDSEVHAYRNIGVDAYKIKTGDEDYNLLTSESLFSGDVQHAFATNAKMKNVRFTVGSSVTSDFDRNGIITYNLHYNPSKFNGEMTNSFKYYEYTGGTSISGVYDDLVFNFNVRVPLIASLE